MTDSAGKGILRQPCGNESETFPCEDYAERSARERDGERFGEQLADHASAVCANGGAHSEFLLPFCAAREKKDGNVATANEQQRRNGAEQEIERGTKRFGVEFGDAAKIDAKFFGVTLGRFLGEFLEIGQKFGVGLSRGDAGAKLDGSAEINVRVARSLERKIHVDVSAHLKRGGISADNRLYGL